ncbi:MAG TPA: glycosyl hydrolase, partial [Terriglobia bacterium]|nr:glycosyl hydrolase [Terriglobia bacterium]
MRLTTLILLLTTLLTMAVAQKQQASQPSEPGAKQSRRARQEKQAATSGTPAAAAAQQAEGEVKGPWKALQYRLIGPFRGGRVVAVSGVVGEPNTFYFGAVAGGVWKTTDGGLNWTPLTDKEKDMSPSIGALAVSESNPNVIYVGTGEACIRGNIVGGNGVYKSIDAGKTWKAAGLTDTHTIGRIIVDPKNPDRAFVAALGHPFADNEERGIFRTLDGGKTWQKVLYKDAKSGGIDVTFAPSNPNLLFAALWQTQRTPWSLDSGGPGSGLYRSSDGGNTWKELTGHGLPDGPLGRIGVTVAGSNPNRVWAIIEAKKGGIYRSDDGGDTWQLMTDDHRFRQRAWYYSHIFADPKSEDTVYILNTGVYRSHDGGKTFARIPAPHGDNHGLWIDPGNPERLINGNDGGATISVDGGKAWSTEYNQPTAQFYHVTTDSRFPYYIYGAQQDNSTVGIASASPDGAIDRPDWYDVGGGESGYIAPDPTDPQIVYAGSYGGEITRYDHRTGELQNMNPWPVNPIGWGAADLKHRFQWTEPIVFSPHDPHTMYFAGEVLFKTTNGGMNWTVISPDLTRNDKSKQQSSGGPITKDNTGVEVYDTIFSVVESPVQKGLIWAGSDDGLVHLTRDGGQHWENVTPKTMPEWGTVSMLEASPRDGGTAYMVVERHKMDDFAPYIFKTTDFGKTWTSLVSGISSDDYVHAVRVDPRRL